MISERLKRALLAAVIFTVIVAIPDYPMMAYVVFVSTFIVWWLAFKTNNRQIWHAVWAGLAIAILSASGLMARDEILDIWSYLLLTVMVSVVVSLASIFVSIIIHIFQTEPTAIETTLLRRTLKAIILIVGVVILFLKAEMYLHSIDGRVITTSISPSGKMTFEVRKSCCLICSGTTLSVRLNKGTRKGYSETCVITANASEPTRSSKFSWNSDETIIRWKSTDNGKGEIDLQKDCGYPANPNSIEESPGGFKFISPSRSKILFRKTTSLLEPDKKIFALRVRRSDGKGWNNYRCNLQIPYGRQDHGGSIRTEDIPDSIQIPPIFWWDKNETVIGEAFVNPSFSFDLKEDCDWK